MIIYLPVFVPSNSLTIFISDYYVHLLCMSLIFTRGYVLTMYINKIKKLDNSFIVDFFLYYSNYSMFNIYYGQNQSSFASEIVQS